MKRIICIFILMSFVACFSACGNKTDDNLTLVRHFGQEKVAEMELKCTDESQLNIANALVAQAKQILSYCGTENDIDISGTYALKEYHSFDKDVIKSDVDIELITTNQKDGKGYVWVKYSVKSYGNDNRLISGSGDIYSRWNIEEQNGAWIVTSIDEIK